MIFDTHCHTKFSTDSNMLLSDALKIAKEKNVGIITTEHLDLISKTDAFKVDIKKYLDSYEKFRSNNYLIGIEVGLTKDTYIQNKEYLKGHDFDFIIGSIHAIDEKDIFETLKNSCPDQKSYYTKYFETMIECLKLYDNFDSLGHIDYILRYGTYENPEFDLSYFMDYIEEVLKILIKKDKLIEFNTRRLNNHSAIENLIKIYKRYKELGGEYVTLGSDSHTHNSIGENFTIAQEILNSLSLSPVYFKKRIICK